MRMRVSFALTLALGLPLVGCGPDAAVEPETPPVVETPEGPQSLDKAVTEEPGDKAFPPGYPKDGAVANPDAANPANPVPAEPEATPKTDDAPKTAAVTLSPEEVEGIKELADEADVKLAMEQKICPVGEEADGTPNHLGGMGKPVKEVVNGKTVFLCCKGCIEDFKADPEKYLAKVGK